MANKSLSLLVCPECKGNLHLSKTSELWCKPCGIAYPIEDNIPIMLVEKARTLTIDEKTDKK